MQKIRKARLKELDTLPSLWEDSVKQQVSLGKEFGEDRLPKMKKDAKKIV